MTRKVPLKTNLGNIRAHTSHVFEEIAERWAIHYAWGIGDSGEHAEGRALDFMTMTEDQSSLRVRMGHRIASHLWSNRRRLGVWYVIYRKRIISINDNSYGPSGRWNRMPDRGNPTANHMDHVHVSFLNSPPPYTPPHEEDPMANLERVSRHGTRTTELTKGEWTETWISDEHVSILGESQSPCDWWGSVGLTVEGLPVGATLQTRFVEVDPDTGEVTKGYPIKETLGNAGKTFVDLHEGGGHCDTDQRLRVVALCWHDGVRVTSASARAFYLP